MNLIKRTDDNSSIQTPGSLMRNPRVEGRESGNIHIDTHTWSRRRRVCMLCNFTVSREEQGGGGEREEGMRGGGGKEGRRGEGHTREKRWLDLEQKRMQNPWELNVLQSVCFEEHGCTKEIG